ncbi:hypothetical protein D6029_18635 [Buttiauxella izardii]|uniref:Uncharacterized protein n=1 Tax=Buttiauxella izardii TaxID=82991 RepID=A0A3A5JTA6_9ENTR|nr:hypothetical protein D6029_18635 [Buttiauxella izardii]
MDSELGLGIIVVELRVQVLICHAKMQRVIYTMLKQCTMYITFSGEFILKGARDSHRIINNLMPGMQWQ